MIERQVQAVRIGPLGTLSIKGLQGDLWSGPTVQSLTLSDQNGVWLEAKNLRLSWQASQLLRRRLEIGSVKADQVLILRRPKLLAPRERRDTTISVQVKSVDIILETRPAYSGVDGRFKLSGQLLFVPKKAFNSDLKAESLTHSGDGLTARLRSGAQTQLSLSILGSEARGGALAGSLGLPADQPFVLKVEALVRDGGGKANLICTTGGQTLTEGQANWSVQGITAKGFFNLENSTLTQGLARHLGPKAQLSLKGVLIKASTYRIAAGVLTDTLSVDVSGNIKRDPMQIDQSLTVLARSTDLSRGFENQWAKTGRFDGQLRGKASDWSLDGIVNADGVTISTYGLRQVRGALKLAQGPRGFTASSSLIGSGGEGTGLLSALLGSAPKADAQIERLKGGPWLISGLQVTGSGLTVDATGRRALLGGWVLDGKARLSELERARAGASGAFNADWSARKTDIDQPWVISAQAQGVGLKTGLVQLDHLLGETPNLKAQGSFSAGTLADARLDLVGAASRAQLIGGLAKGGLLFGQMDWQAKGPLPIGPIIVEGAASGQGALGGTLKAPTLSLSALLDQVDLPQLTLNQAKLDLNLASQPDGWSGQAALQANSDYGPVQAEVGLLQKPDGLDLQGLKANGAGVNLAGDVSLRRDRLSSAALTLAVGPGAVLSRGTLTGNLILQDGPGQSQANLDLKIKATDAVLKANGALISQASLSAQGVLAALTYQVDGRGRTSGVPVQLSGSGQANLTDGNLAFQGTAKVRGAQLTTLDPIRMQWDETQHKTQARLGLGQGQGIVGLEIVGAGPGLKGQVDLKGINLAALGEDLIGTVDGSLSLSGRADQLSAEGQIRMAGARTTDAPSSLGLDGWIKGRLDQGRMVLEAQASNGQGLKAETQIDLPAQASAQPFRIALVRDQPMKGRVDVAGEIKPIWDLFFSGNQSVSGLLDAHGTIAGTLQKPSFQGTGDLSKGSFDDVGAGLRLRDLAVQAEANADQVNIRSLSANDGSGGEVTGQGRLGLAPDSASTLSLVLKRFKLIDNEQIEALASGTATLVRGADGRTTATGDLIIDRADVTADSRANSSVVTLDVIEINKPQAEQAVERARFPVPVVGLNVRLQAGRGIFVRGRGLDAEMAMDARVNGTTAAPILSGKATIVRGEYDFAGKRFSFDDRGAVYLATRLDRIRLDLTATREDTNLTAVIVIKGTAEKPLITLTSTPALPNDEVLSQVLFGRSASQLSPLEAAQLASAVTGLATGGGLDVIGNLRSFARLDRLALGGGSAGAGVTVSGGKYVTDDVYIELTGGGREGPSAQVEWRVSRRLAVISKLASQGEGKLSIRWRKDERRKTP